MKTRVVIGELTHCSCGAEGGVLFRFVDDGEWRTAGYQGSDAQAVEAFRRGEEQELLLRFVYGALEPSNFPKTIASQQVTGDYLGNVVHDGDDYALLDAGRRILVAVEGGVGPRPAIGARVTVSGEFQFEIP
jgi:hypothetical protein